MSQVWRFVDTGPGAPAWNMAVDEAIAIAHGRGYVPPTLRFYDWEPATLSIGYFQKAEEEVDFAELKRRGFGFVRRPTGGRAVLHDRELTYSIIVAEAYPGMPSGVTEAYRVLSEGLLYGFQALQLDAELTRSGASFEAGSAVCFDSPSWYELVVEGRKAAGSAQVRKHGSVLQHGSILLELDAEALFAVLKFPSERVKERMLRAFPDKAAAIQDLRRGRGLEAAPMAEIRASFRSGLARGLEVELVESSLTEEELALAKQLVEEKYGSDGWNLRR